MDQFSQISLIASFIAGMVALFAPCCFSYLLPAYFANIFKEKKQVILMTLIYSLGIFAVMLPVVVGAKVLADIFLQLHDYSYFFGGMVMIATGILAFLGLKIHQPRLAWRQPGRPDIISTFVLGLFAGITSSCCAPVLLGVLTISALTPNLAMSFFVGLAYVLGMVAPLYLASFLIDKNKLLERPVLKLRLLSLKLGAKIYPIFVSNVIAGAAFFLAGAAMISLTLAGKLGMPEPAKINWEINQLTQSSTANFIFAIIGAYLMIKLIQRGLK